MRANWDKRENEDEDDDEIGFMGNARLIGLCARGGDGVVMMHRWKILEADPDLVAAFSSGCGVSPLLARCLVHRGVRTLDEAAVFLNPRLSSLSDPFLLPGMDAAIHRLFAARANDEEVLIFGDYDVDGVTSVALLSEVFAHFGIRSSWYLPHRMDEGYGLTLGALENCLARNCPRLLVAVDCGSTAVECVRTLSARGIDVVILDHHKVSDPPPQPAAFVNPHLGEASAPFQHLCSAGLAFKLAHALVKRGRELGMAEAALDIRPLLDLAALGTIADLVPLRGENRVLAAAGLARLNETKRPGLVALKRVAGVKQPVGVYEVGFQLGPRLNAAGRLETAERALSLLLSNDMRHAEDLAMELDARNAERRRIEQAMVEQVVGAVRSEFQPDRDWVIVQGQMFWHVGVVGIVASRVLREFHRPTIIFGGDGAEWRGSGRSIAGFDLAEALQRCGDLLARHGGHAMAAGLSMAPENLEVFRERLNAVARARLTEELLLPELSIEADVALSELTLERVRELSRLGPFGQQNPEVILAARNLQMRGAPELIGREKQHAKFRVADGGGEHLAVWWQSAGKPLPSGRFDLVFIPQINTYGARERVQLKVLDWRRSEAQTQC